MSNPIPSDSEGAHVRSPWMHEYSPTESAYLSESDAARWGMRNSLHPAYIIVHILSMIAGIILSAVNWYSVEYEAGSAATLLCVSAVLFTVFTVSEAIGFIGGAFYNLTLTKGFIRLLPVAFVIVLAAQVISLTNTYANKSKLMSNCIHRETEDLQSYSGSSPLVSQNQEISDYCHNRWANIAAWDIVWLILIVIFGLCFYALSVRYLQNALNMVSSRPGAQSMPSDMEHAFEEDQAFAMQGLSRTHKADDMDLQDDAFGDRKSEFAPMNDHPDDASFINATADPFNDAPIVHPTTIHTAAPQVSRFH